MKILITGAGGNVGLEVIRALHEMKTDHQLVAGVFSPEKSARVLKPFEGLEYRKLDFADPAGFDAALEGIGRVFLLRPPQLADVPKYFGPFIDAMRLKGIREIVFLSVQGVEEQEKIPHHKLEKLILEKELDHVFLRPSYFMQNLSTTLVHEIITRDRIFIPSGSLKFTWVDARDIGKVGARVLDDFDSHKNRNLEITGSEQLDFKEVAVMLSRVTGRDIRYESPSLLKFFLSKRKQGLKPAMIFVMIMLHYLPRFSKKTSPLTGTVKEITGSEPGTLEEFLRRESAHFSKGVSQAH